MMFNTIDFVVFLSVVFPTFFLLPDRWRATFLLAASYFFYGYWSVKFLGLLVFTMALDYWIALRIDGTSEERNRKRYLVLSVVANLGLLFYFKYCNLFLGLFSTLSGRAPLHWDIILPFGISFYTFHAMSYTIDVYRRVIPAERNFTLYSSYVMFFPQLVAGPIARASHLLGQFETPKRLRAENLREGAYLVAKGYIYKVLLADTFAGYVDGFFGEMAAKTPTTMTQAVYFFAFQIYCDFAGYTLIARGIARWFDFDLVENFRTPYFATSLTDFWRRWHISLSTWLRDYLYISLGGNRHGRLATYRNLLVTMVLGGLWHGGNWNFAIWGALHGSYLVVEKALADTAVGRFVRLPALRALRWLVVFHLVLIAWIFFRADSFPQATYVLGECWKCWAHPLQFLVTREIYTKLWLMAFVLFAFEFAEGRLQLQQRFERAPWLVRLATIYAAIVAVALGVQLDAKAFIYFQF